MNPNANLTPDDLRIQLMKQLQEQGAQYLGEVAMPGISMPVMTTPDER